MKFNDEGKIDDKIVVVPINKQSKTNDINSLDDLPVQKIDQIAYYFSHYKDQIKLGSTVVEGWGDIAEAKTTINQAIERWLSLK